MTERQTDKYHKMTLSLVKCIRRREESAVNHSGLCFT